MADPSFDPDGEHSEESQSDRDSELLTAHEALAENRTPLMDYRAQQALLTDRIHEIVSNTSDPSDVAGLMDAEHLFSRRQHVRANSLVVALRRKLDRLHAMNPTTPFLIRETQWRISHWALIGQFMQVSDMLYQQFLQQENE